MPRQKSRARSARAPRAQSSFPYSPRTATARKPPAGLHRLVRRPAAADAAAPPAAAGNPANESLPHHLLPLLGFALRFAESTHESGDSSDAREIFRAVC